MKTTTKYFLACCMMFPTLANAGQVIDVLFIFDNDARVLIQNKQAWANTQVAAVNNILSQSGAPVLTFNASVYTNSIGYDATGKNEQAVITWMYGAYTLPDPPDPAA